MKRVNNLFNKISNIQNIRLADINARKGKQYSYGVLKHNLHAELHYLELLNQFENNTHKTSKYDIFKIYEPKERIIYRLPYYPDRIAHHAIMNILKPIWNKVFTKDTYSCIKGRGIHLLYKNLKKVLTTDVENTKYCLKLDIKKFYPSIDHSILKQIIRKKIKDKKVLSMLDELIDSTSGVPIGNDPSQYFANLYLAYFDHWVKEELKVKYYFRYADDIVILSNSKDLLRQWLIAIRKYLLEKLKLELKGNELIFPVELRGIDFVGFVFRHKYIRLRKSIKLRMLKVIKDFQKNKISSILLKLCLDAYYGWLKCCNSKHLLLKICNLTGVNYSNWMGIRIPISRIKNKNIYLVHVDKRDTYFLLLFIYKNKAYEAKSKNKKLYNNLKNKRGNIII